MSLFHVHARLFEGTLDAPTRNELQSRETDDRSSAMALGYALAERGFRVWVYEHRHDGPLGERGPYRVIVVLDPADVDSAPPETSERETVYSSSRLPSRSCSDMTGSEAAYQDVSPLSSASLRYLLRETAVSEGPGPVGTRPFALCAATSVVTPIERSFCFCHERQVAVDGEGRPLLDTMGKDWRTKSTTDGDEGPEENWGWEE